MAAHAAQRSLKPTSVKPSGKPVGKPLLPHIGKAAPLTCMGRSHLVGSGAPPNAMKAMPFAFSAACYENCEPGQMLLTADELAMWAQLTQRDVRFCPLFVQVQVVPLLGAFSAEEEADERPFTRSMAREVEEQKEAAGKVHLDCMLTGEPVDRVGLHHVARTFQLDFLEVVEAISEEHKEGAFAMHLSKRVFAKEERLVEWRVFHGERETCQCHTWILCQAEAPKETSRGFGNHSNNDCQCDSEAIGSRARFLAAATSKASEATARSFGNQSSNDCQNDNEGSSNRARFIAAAASKVAAAVTVRINRYRSGEGRWAQILNMSTGQERCGFGTMLMAGVEALLKLENVDVVLLYPAQNGSAPCFWTSLGYTAPEPKTSLLPMEELIPFTKGGPLIPEMEGSTGELLPRWEKRIAPPHMSAMRPEVPSIPLAPSATFGSAYRQASEVRRGSRLGIGPLQELYKAARREQRQRLVDLQQSIARMHRIERGEDDWRDLKRPTKTKKQPIARPAKRAKKRVET